MQCSVACLVCGPLYVEVDREWIRTLLTKSFVFTNLTVAEMKWRGGWHHLNVCVVAALCWDVRLHVGSVPQLHCSGRTLHDRFLNFAGCMEGNVCIRLMLTMPFEHWMVAKQFPLIMSTAQHSKGIIRSSFVYMRDIYHEFSRSQVIRNAEFTSLRSTQISLSFDRLNYSLTRCQTIFLKKKIYLEPVALQIAETRNESKAIWMTMLARCLRHSYTIFIFSSTYFTSSRLSKQTED